jgi:hypothetical protein
MSVSKYNLLCLLILALAGCDEEDSGVKPTVEKYAMLEILSGNNQSGVTGQFLKDSIVIKVIPKSTALKVDRFYVRAKMTKGNGYLAELHYSETAFAASNGKIRTSWSLGCNEKDQLLTFYLYNYDSCMYNMLPAPVCAAVDSITIKASSSTPSGWNRSCGLVDPDYYFTKFKTFNGQVYAVNRGSLFKMVRQDALWWEKITTVPVTDVVDFDFTSTGKIFVASDQHGVYTSNDMKVWNSLSNGLLDPRNPIGLLVEDSVAYVSYYFDGLYRLRSGSTFWKKLLVNGFYNDEYKFITRHPNGTLYVTDKWDTIWESENSGDLWSNTFIEYKYKNYDVADFQIHPSGQIYIGSYDATLAILDPDTYTGDTFTYYQWNASMQVINNITFRDDGVYYLVNFTPNPGIYTSALGYQKYDIGYEDKFSRFVFDSQGRVIVMKYDGVYYKKE